MPRKDAERMSAVEARSPSDGAVPDAAARQSPLAGHDIVFLSHQRWNTHTTPVHHTVWQLVRHNRVLFMEPPDSMGWLLHEPPAREALGWIGRPLDPMDRNLWVYHTPPVFLPGQARWRWIQRSISALYGFMVRRAKSLLAFRNPLYWVFQFNTVDVLDSLRASFVVYECAEDHAAYETDPVLQKHIERMDARLCRRADVVIVPSQNMLEARRTYNAQTYRVPWGVDVEHYRLAADPETPIPADVAALPRPIIGLVGMLDGRRLHTELLLQLASRHPDWQIVLVGRCMPNLDQAPLRARPNVHFLGFKPVEALPGYCKAFDVCIIPYMINEFTRSIMPLKLIEYLATGRPAVATALPAADELRDVIRVADTNEQFEQLVIDALHEPPGLAEQRMRRAAEYDWYVVGRRKLALVAERMSAAGFRPQIR